MRAAAPPVSERNEAHNAGEGRAERTRVEGLLLELLVHHDGLLRARVPERLVRLQVPPDAAEDDRMDRRKRPVDVRVVDLRNLPFWLSGCTHKQITHRHREAAEART
jgi:hypothetical protein